MYFLVQETASLFRHLVSGLLANHAYEYSFPGQRRADAPVAKIPS